MRLLAACCWVVLPALGEAEGRVEIFDCTITQVCQTDGTCMPADEKIAFTLSPEAVGSDGGGRFTLAYDDASVPAELTTDPPRLTWGTEDGTAHLFTVLGPSDAGPNWLWFDSLWLSSWGELADMVTDIRFLTCKVTN